jgi:DNA-binding transcriptional LysR family regulator
LPKQHPLSGKASVTIEDIKNCQFSLCRENTELFQHITEMFRTSGCKLKNYKFYSDWATMVASISSGSAITISGKIAFETDAIKTIPLSHPDHIRQLYIVATDSKEKAPPVRRFLDFCCEYSHEGHSLIL